MSKILYLRQRYHFGPGKIADYLKWFHTLSIACASVHRILCCHGLNRLPAIKSTGGTRTAGRGTKRHSPAIACRSISSSLYFSL